MKKSYECELGAAMLVGCLCLPSVILIPCAAGRCYLRQEPDAGNPLVRIRGGACEQSRSLLRLLSTAFHEWLFASGGWSWTWKYATKILAEFPF
jgi:hypothetical protein